MHINIYNNLTMQSETSLLNQLQIIHRIMHTMFIQIQQMIKIKAFFISLLLIAVIKTSADEIRFGDADMLKEHHKHKNPSDTPLNVFLIPHSHDDVGWLKTVDNYFYGGDQETQWAGVRYTIDSVINQLSLNPNHKFSIVEVAFLYRWWNGANSTQRNNMVQALKNGQLEFINAGWCMSDEATPYYEDMIDQMTIGLRWIKETFGFIPSIGWHIDPFGHQASNAAMFSQIGFNAWFFARADFQDKSVRMSNKGLQMIWHPTQYSGNDNSIFTHLNYYHYSNPPGFCFDLACTDEPIKEDPTLEGYNLDKKSQEFVQYFKSMALHFRSSNLIHTLGQDFSYGAASINFGNYDKLLDYINSKPEFGVKIKYATPSQYLKVINAEGLVYPTKYDDFFPYADREHSYWGGYFVSRVALKGFVRQSGRYLQTVRSHVSLLKMGGNSNYITQNIAEMEAAIWELEMSMGILQHHDAVAGTAKQKVTNDYFIIGSRGLAKLNNFYEKIVKEQITNEIGETPTQIFTRLWNNTANEYGINAVLSQGKSVLINLYNPGSKSTRTIKLKVSAQNMDIISTSNQRINGDLICSNPIDSTDCELFFNLDFEQTAYNFVKLVPLANQGSVQIIKMKEVTIQDITVVWNITNTVYLKLYRALQTFQLNLPDQIFPFSLTYNYYESYQDSGQKSGAYIFRPSINTTKAPKIYSKISGFEYAEGSAMTVILIKGDKITNRFYLSRNNQYIQNYGFQIETYVNSINVDDKIGKEVVLTLSTKYSTNKTFFTDSNGLEEQKRIKDFRPTWYLINDEPVASNYYPINSHISIVDTVTKKKLSILTDRSQGGSSMNDGEIQIMIHRRCLYDDSRGVNEALNQTQIDGQGLRQLFRHYIILGQKHRALQKYHDQRILISWANTSTNTFVKRTTVRGIFPVPENVKLYLRAYKDGSYLLRLHNFDTTTSTIVSIPNGWKATEYTLGANQLLSDWTSKKYKWNEQPYILGQKQHIKKIHEMQLQYELLEGQVSLKPFEIKTFILTKI